MSLAPSEWSRHQIGALRSLKTPFLSLGGDASPAIQVTTEKQFDDFVEEFRRFVGEVGYFLTYNQAVGEK